MMQTLSSRLERISNGRAALAVTLVFFLFMIFVLPGQAEKSAAYSGSAGSPDQSFWYSAGDLYGMAEAYGPEGREAYIRARFTFDLVFPLVYAAFLSVTIGWSFKKAFPDGSVWRLANLAPLAGMLFDFLENSAAALVMARFPAETPGIAHAAPFFTVVKWLFVGGSFGLLLAGLLIALTGRIRRT